jgi:molybdenum cofactor cytidylyltransferase
LPKSLYAGVFQLRGDTGARQLIINSGLPIMGIDIGAAARTDIDTPGDVVAMGGRLSSGID